MIEASHDPQPLNLDRRTRAMIGLLNTPVSWASKAYVMGMADDLALACRQAGRADLSDLLLRRGLP